MLSFSLRDKEVPVEERNGDAHDEAEQAANEEEGGEGEEEVVEGETAGDEAPAEEETDEVTDDTVNAAPLQSIVPASIRGMFCLLLPSSSHHSWNALFFPLPFSHSTPCFPFPPH